jgi:hypothetical protein
MQEINGVSGILWGDQQLRKEYCTRVGMSLKGHDEVCECSLSASYIRSMMEKGLSAASADPSRYTRIRGAPSATKLVLRRRGPMQRHAPMMPKFMFINANADIY